VLWKQNQKKKNPAAMVSAAIAGASMAVTAKTDINHICLCEMLIKL
jgi:hypothetical protein